MLQSACRKMSAFALLALDPRHTTISPQLCMMPSISRVASAEQSVNNETNKGTLSTFSKCGRMFSMPRGSFAWKRQRNPNYDSFDSLGVRGDRVLTRFDISKLTGALCSVLSVKPLSDRQFSSSMAESLDTRCRLN